MDFSSSSSSAFRALTVQMTSEQRPPDRSARRRRQALLANGNHRQPGLPLLTQRPNRQRTLPALRIHLPWMSRATVQGFGILPRPLRLQTERPYAAVRPLRPLRLGQRNPSAGYMKGATALSPSAIYLGVGTSAEKQNRILFPPPIPQSRVVVFALAVALGKVHSSSLWNEASEPMKPIARGEDWLTDESVRHGRRESYDKPCAIWETSRRQRKVLQRQRNKVPLDEPCVKSAQIWFPHTPFPQTEPNSQRRSPTPPPSPLPHPHPQSAQVPTRRTSSSLPKRGGLGGLPRRGMGAKGKSRTLPQEGGSQGETQVSLNQVAHPAGCKAIPIAGEPRQVRHPIRLRAALAKASATKTAQIVSRRKRSRPTTSQRPDANSSKTSKQAENPRPSHPWKRSDTR